ncbi:hypothetical protein [Ensifer soli]|uniref:hypothetical protein n=1 Tax=Ciceribacter sp. sgz301302 TaxID=3342379 RepID=UPI0035B79929
MTTETKRPSHAVYHVEGEGKKAYWTKIGAAWMHDDGEGFNISISCIPVNGRLTVRKPKAEESQREEGR